MSRILGNLPAAVEKESGTATRQALQRIAQALERLQDEFTNVRRNNLLVASHADLQNLAFDDSGHTGFASTTQLATKASASQQIISGAGLTGGGDLSADRTLAVGAGTGITVNADDVAVNQAASLTWTGTETFSLESVHNGGVDLGTSGRIDSNVANSASNTSFVLQPSVAMTATVPTVDRWIYRLNDQGGNATFVVNGDGSFQFGGTGNTGAYISASAPISQAYGISFAPSNSGSGTTITGFANSIVGGYFAGASISGASYSNQFGGHFNTNVSGIPSTLTKAFGSIVEHSKNASVTITDLGGLYFRSNITNSKGTMTNVYSVGYAEAPSGGTNRFGLVLAESTSGTINDMLRLLGTGRIAFGESAASTATTEYINQGADAHLDLYAATSIDMNADVDISAKNIITDTSTGTKIGTSTSQKLGFFNASPVARPSAYTPTNVSADRSYDANATSTDELADVLGTLIADLQSLGLIG